MTKHSILKELLFRRDNRFLILLVSLLLFFVVYSFVIGLLWAELVLNLSFILILFSGIFAISETRSTLIISLILALLVLIFRWSFILTDILILGIFKEGISIIFWSYVAVSILKFVLKQPKVTPELIYGALSVYFILGLAWASCYQLLESQQPGSFSLPEHQSADQPNFFRFWYFSMVTLTTLGFGDISPVTMPARTFVVLEAIMGQFFLAVLIANLVGRAVAQKD
jgi:Ion channel